MNRFRVIHLCFPCPLFRTAKGRQRIRPPRPLHVTHQGVGRNFFESPRLILMSRLVYVALIILLKSDASTNFWTHALAVVGPSNLLKKNLEYGLV